MSKPKFTRGYEESRQKLNNNPRYTRSCYNCVYYYQASGDKSEMCQNEDVLSYDMVIEPNNVYCLKWTPPNTSNAKKEMFKRGRAQLDDY